MIDKANKEQGLLDAIYDLNAALLALQKALGIPAVEIPEEEVKAHSPMEACLRRATAQVQSAKDSVQGIHQVIARQIEALGGGKELC